MENANIAEGLGVVVVVVALIFAACGCYMNWRIAAKAGYHGAYSLLMLVPIVNVAVYLYFVFAKWPIQRELEEMKDRQGVAVPPQVS